MAGAETLAKFKAQKFVAAQFEGCKLICFHLIAREKCSRFCTSEIQKSIMLLRILHLELESCNFCSVVDLQYNFKDFDHLMKFTQLSLLTFILKTEDNLMELKIDMCCFFLWNAL